MSDQSKTTKQSAWSYACKQYAMTYAPDDQQRDMWLRRADLPKSEAYLVKLRERAENV